MHLGSSSRIDLNLRNSAYRFVAGQYANVVLPAIDAALPLSIGSAPQRLPQLTFYYRSTPGLAAAEAFDHLLRTGTTLMLTEAQGSVHLPRDSALRPMLLIAAGTGSAQAFSMLDSTYLNSDHQQSHQLLQLAAEPAEYIVHANEPQWLQQGLSVERIADPRTDRDNLGLVWLAERASNFRDHWILISGAPGFVYEVADTLQAAGIDLRQTHSDVYDYAPR